MFSKTTLLVVLSAPLASAFTAPTSYTSGVFLLVTLAVLQRGFPSGNFVGFIEDDA
jgi:hypothetical protein